MPRCMQRVSGATTTSFQFLRKAAQAGTIPPCMGDDFPVHGKAYRDLSVEQWAQCRSITTERHFALNWLCGDAPENRWDETPTST